MPLNSLKDTGNPIQERPDVQRTSLSLDVLGRFICNTWDEAVYNGGKPFDAVVIGAGMFGGYCAEKIFRFGEPRNLRVLVLEAGPFLVPTHVQNLPQIGLNVPDPIFPAADNGQVRDLVWGMPWRSNVQFVGQAYCFGGKSLYWGGWCPKLLPDDLATWPDDVREYLNEHYGDLEKETGVTDGEGGSKFIKGQLFCRLKSRIEGVISRVDNLDRVEDPPLAVQGQSPASGVFAFDKYSSAFLLAGAAREAATAPYDSQRRLFVVPNTHVIRLVISGGAVTGIEASVNGQVKFLQISPACSVVLGAGTIESTRLALVSFPTSINPANELMGRNLISHIRTNAFVQIPREALIPGPPRLLQTGAVLVRGHAAQGNFHLQITASADRGENSDALLFTVIPDIDQFRHTLANQRSDKISITIRGESQMIGDKRTPVPNANGRWINLSPGEKDEFGVPRAAVQFKTTRDEEELANAMDAAIRNLARALGGEITGVPTRDPLGSTHHEAGTLWMGEDRHSSVTNTDGRFHHVDNAYCTDQSLFVNMGSVNPTLTGLVLSRKVAKAVVERATRSQPHP